MLYTFLYIPFYKLRFISEIIERLNEGGNSMRTIWSSRKRILFFGLPLSFTKYTLTDEKFIINSGFLTSTEDEIRLYRIVDLSLKRGLGQKIFIKGF